MRKFSELELTEEQEEFVDKHIGLDQVDWINQG